MRATLVTLVAGVTAAVLAVPGAASATVGTVKGQAYGYRSFDLKLFNSFPPGVAATPQVLLAPNASNSPQNGSATSGTVTAGPATLLTSDGITVNTHGTTGAAGSVGSSSTVRNLNKATTQPTTTGSEILTADSVTGTCTASESGVSRSTTTSNATVTTDNGLDLNDDGDFVDSGEHAPTYQAVLASPAANTLVEGHVHVGTGTDTFRVVFNEQTPEMPDVVNAVHEYFLGPSLSGDLIIGRAACGVNTVFPSTVKISTGAAGGGNAASLQADDGNYFVDKSGTRTTSFFGTFTGVPKSTVKTATITYVGDQSQNATQTIYAYKYGSGWTNVGSTTVGTADKVVSIPLSTPTSFISGTGQMKIRVKSQAPSGALTTSADLLQVRYTT